MRRNTLISQNAWMMTELIHISVCLPLCINCKRPAICVLMTNAKMQNLESAKVTKTKMRTSAEVILHFSRYQFRIIKVRNLWSIRKDKAE